MPRGGKRQNAGRKAGSQNKMEREVKEKALRAGISPLDYMLGVMRDPEAEYGRRDDMAKAAARCQSRWFRRHGMMRKT